MYSVKIKIYRVDSLATYAYSCRICLLEFFLLVFWFKEQWKFSTGKCDCYIHVYVANESTLCYSFAWQIFVVRIACSAWQASGLQDSLCNSKSLYNSWLQYERRGNLHESGPLHYSCIEFYWTNIFRSIDGNVSLCTAGVSISTDGRRNTSATLLIEVGYFLTERRSN